MIVRALILTVEDGSLEGLLLGFCIGDNDGLREEAIGILGGGKDSVVEVVEGNERRFSLRALFCCNEVLLSASSFSIFASVDEFALHGPIHFHASAQSFISASSSSSVIA